MKRIGGIQEREAWGWMWDGMEVRGTEIEDEG